MNTIEVSLDVYLRIIAGKPVEVQDLQLDIGKQYKIVNISNGTYLRRRLKGMLGNYLYWE
jgi:hypothetical protein